jgi:hypothetical protein
MSADDTATATGCVVVALRKLAAAAAAVTSSNRLARHGV